MRPRFHPSCFLQVSEDPVLLVVDGFLSSEECAAVRALGGPHLKRSKVSAGGSLVGPRFASDLLSTVSWKAMLLFWLPCRTLGQSNRTHAACRR